MSATPRVFGVLGRDYRFRPAADAQKAVDDAKDIQSGEELPYSYSEMYLPVKTKKRNTVTTKAAKVTGAKKATTVAVQEAALRHGLTDVSDAIAAKAEGKQRKKITVAAATAAVRALGPSAKQRPNEGSDEREAERSDAEIVDHAVVAAAPPSAKRVKRWDVRPDDKKAWLLAADDVSSSATTVTLSDAHEEKATPSLDTKLDPNNLPDFLFQCTKQGKLVPMKPSSIVQRKRTIRRCLMEIPGVVGGSTGHAAPHLTIREYLQRALVWMCEDKADAAASTSSTYYADLFAGFVQHKDVLGGSDDLWSPIEAKMREARRVATVASHVKRVDKHPLAPQFFGGVLVDPRICPHDRIRFILDVMTTLVPTGIEGAPVVRSCNRLSELHCASFKEGGDTWIDIENMRVVISGDKRTAQGRHTARLPVPIAASWSEYLCTWRAAAEWDGSADLFYDMSYSSVSQACARVFARAHCHLVQTNAEYERLADTYGEGVTGCEKPIHRLRYAGNMEAATWYGVTPAMLDAVELVHGHSSSMAMNEYRTEECDAGPKPELVDGAAVWAPTRAGLEKLMEGKSLESVSKEMRSVKKENEDLRAELARQAEAMRSVMDRLASVEQIPPTVVNNF